MIEIFLEYLWAVRINLYFALVSLGIGFGLAVFIALGLMRRHGLIFRLCSAYVYFFRGSPLLVQFFFFYYFLRSSGLHRIEINGDEAFSFVLDALYLAPLVLLLNTTAYSAVIFANALKAVPKGDLEAADAYGFSPFKKFWRITWPSALRIAWPAYTNEAVFLFLSTTLVYASIPVTTWPGGANFKDVFVTANDLMERTFNPFAAYLPAMAVFVILTLGIFFVFGLVNDYLNRHLADKSAKPRLRFRPNFIR